MVLIANTYVDLELVRDVFLSVGLYDEIELEVNIITTAPEATRQINSELGRTTAITDTELATVQFDSVVSAASQLCASLMEMSRQERQKWVSQVATDDRDFALARLQTWKAKQGITQQIPSSTDFCYVQPGASYGL